MSFSFLPASLTSTRPRRGLTYLAATLGTAYLAGKWALASVLDGAERGRRDGWARDDLARRFNLNLQDSQFTVLALVPTLAQQLGEEIDVEEVSRELGDRARREREERERERDKEEKAHAAEAEEAARHEARPNGDAREPLASSGDPLHSPLLPMLNGTTSSTAAAAAAAANGPALNPAAPVFQPRAPSPPQKVDASTVSLPKQEGEGASWAEVVKREVPQAGEIEGEAAQEGQEKVVVSGRAQVDERYEVDGAADSERETSEKVEFNGVEAQEQEQEHEVKQDAQQDAAADEPEGDAEGEPAVPEKSKAELWNEIKLRSFTRLFTSIYVLVLLSLQTHVQLALLGRSAYVSSLLSSLPPRSPSPCSSAHHPDPPFSDAALAPALDDSQHPNQDEDLESALYAAKSLPPTAEEARKDMERKYLTFSWWLLHEGWKVIWKRVEAVVEEVVGPMGLKTPLVYGELGALFAQIRRRIEQDADGKLFDFSPALHPPTRELEVRTLIAGGSYTPPSPSASDLPPHLSSPDPITPSLRSLLDETSDALDSPDSAFVRALSLDKLFSVALEKLEVAFRSPAVKEGRGARFEDVTEKEARLASLLPVLTRLSASKGEAVGAVLAGGVNGNEWVEALEDVREMREFAAVLYGSWDRDNLRASCVL
ncbi:peroxisomal biogenesis factor 3 [Rhodotorula toruloides]|uniref:Peroxisomal biogenesis factor 3 n=1 Tax=Rhodotorula toruloides TaxID=5286 RepID=A0A511KQH8_RHOTO|nr:peroxisomal biogenesis factor 3 [Rhodotorula toruloides]